MSNYKISVVVGSLRKGSYNKKLAKAIIKLLPDNVEAEIVSIAELPLYNQDSDSNIPVKVQEFKTKIASSQGVIFVTPEYNRSIPGVLKNAIDQGSRPYGQSIWDAKVAGIMGVSPGRTGTAMAQQHLRNSLASLNMPTFNTPEAFITWEDGLVDDNDVIAEKSRNFVQKWLNNYLEFLKRYY